MNYPLWFDLTIYAADNRYGRTSDGFIAIEAAIPNPRPSAERADSGEILDGKADRLARCCGATTKVGEKTYLKYSARWQSCVWDDAEALAALGRGPLGIASEQAFAR